MKLQAELNGENHQLEIKRDGQKVWAKIDDREYELEVSEVEPDLYLFKHHHQIHRIYVGPDGPVNIGQHQLEIKLIDPKRLRGSTGSESNTDGSRAGDIVWGIADHNKLFGSQLSFKKLTKLFSGKFGQLTSLV